MTISSLARMGISIRTQSVLIRGLILYVGSTDPTNHTAEYKLSRPKHLVQNAKVAGMLSASGLGPYLKRGRRTCSTYDLDRSSVSPSERGQAEVRRDSNPETVAQASSEAGTQATSVDAAALHHLQLEEL